MKISGFFLLLKLILDKNSNNGNSELRSRAVIQSNLDCKNRDGHYIEGKNILRFLFLLSSDDVCHTHFHHNTLCKHFSRCCQPCRWQPTFIFKNCAWILAVVISLNGYHFCDLFHKCPIPRARSDLMWIACQLYL